MAEKVVHYNVHRWIEENKYEFTPPVCNKCMFNHQLKVFFIGGPNSRKDFHLEEGEEFFFQLKGDMCLPVVENGIIQDVHINEGQVFMLPSRTLHSPQRYKDTIGFVCERKRAPWEYDSLRYQIDGTTDILFERWIHLNDVVKDLPPVIKEYFASEACRTGKPTSDSVIPNRPFNPDPNVRINDPVYLKDWIKERQQAMEVQKTLQLFGPPEFKSVVNVLGPGYHHVGVPTSDADVFVYLLSGSALVQPDQDTSFRINENSTFLVPGKRSAGMNIVDNGYAITVCMETPIDPPANATIL